MNYFPSPPMPPPPPPLQTPYGTVHILNQEQIFKKFLEIILTTAKGTFLSRLFRSPHPSIALSGGSTPISFYKWLAIHPPPPPLSKTLNNIFWFTSDERYVPLTHEDSNFGNASRFFFTPLHIPSPHQCPWPVHLPPHEAAATFEALFKKNFSSCHLFDLCCLGIGDDCHTASIFPNSELIASPPLNNFAAIFVENKGWRLTITPYGLQKCKKILVLVEGQKKADALSKVFQEPFNPVDKPIQFLKNYASNVTWLIDPLAASKLGFL